MVEFDRGTVIHYVDEEISSLYEASGHSNHYQLRPDLVLRCFLNRQMFAEIIDAWASKHKLKESVIFEAHGTIYENEWYLCDNKIPVTSVQRLVQELDGKCTAIMLLICNPRNDVITSNQSLVFHPNKALNLPTALATGHMRLFVPGCGYMEKDYKKLRKTIDSLR